MRTRRRCLGAAAAAVVAVGLASCSGAPTSQELADSLRQPDSLVPVPADSADCVAEVLQDSDLSDETLTAIADNDETYTADSAEQSKLTEAVSTALSVCA